MKFSDRLWLFWFNHGPLVICLFGACLVIGLLILYQVRPPGG